VPTGKRRTETLEYDGDPSRTYELAGPLWYNGVDVLIHIGDTTIPYFDFLVRTRCKNSEPIIEIARYIITRRAMRKSYLARSTRMAVQYAKVLGASSERIRAEVWEAVTALEEADALH